LENKLKTKNAKLKTTRKKSKVYDLNPKSKAQMSILRKQSAAKGEFKYLTFSHLTFI